MAWEIEGAWVVTIKKKIESGNRLLRAHWAVRKNLKKDYLQELATVLPKSLPSFMTLHRRLRIISHRKRLLDKDNLYAGAKPLIDALKEMKWIYDDAPQYLALTVLQVKDIKNPRTVIFIGGKINGFQDE